MPISPLKKSFVAMLFVLTQCTGALAAEYTLESAVIKALENSPTISGAEAGVKAAEAARESVIGTFGPSLDASYDLTRTHQSSHKAYFLSLLEVELTQPLFTGYNLLSTYQKAALEEERQAAVLENVRLQLALDVQENFFLYLKAREDTRSAQDAVARLSEQLKVTTAFNEVGLRPHLDVLQAQVNLSEAENQLIVARHTESIQHAKLNTLLALPVEELNSYVGQLQPIAFTQNFEECLEQAYRQRPDMFIAKKTIEMASKDIDIAKSNYYPQINATAGWTSTTYDYTSSAASSADSHYTAWEIGLGATWNIFDWGTTENNIKKNKYILAQTKAEESTLRFNIANEVKTRMLTLTESVKRIAVAETTLEQANEAYSTALARYQAQVGTNVDVLDAQAALTSAEAQVTGAKAVYLVALAYLNTAMGRLAPNLISQ